MIVVVGSGSDGDDGDVDDTVLFRLFATSQDHQLHPSGSHSIPRWAFWDRRERDQKIFPLWPTDGEDIFSLTNRSEDISSLTNRCWGYFLFDQQMVRMIKSSNVVAPKFNLNFPAGTTLQRKQTRQFHFDPILKQLEQHLTFGERKKLM